MFKFVFKVLSAVMTLGLFTTACAAQAPQGQLIYCSYACAGAAGRPSTVGAGVLAAARLEDSAALAGKANRMPD